MNQIKLLNAITNAQKDFVFTQKSSVIFEKLLDELLLITGSKTGFIGEVLIENNKPFLKTHSVNNINLNRNVHEFVENHAPKADEFHNLKSLFGEVITTKKPVVSNNPSTDSRAGDLTDGHPRLECFLGVPFFFDGRLNGIVGLANRKEGYDEEFIEKLSPILVTCASLIEGFKNIQRKDLVENLLKDSIISLQESNDELNKLSYVTSHDFKTPLRGINLLVDLLEEDLNEIEIPESVNEKLIKIKERSQLMYSLIEDVLLYTKAGLEKEKEKINISEFFGEISDSLIVRNNDVNIKYHLNNSIILFNKTHLFQIIFNIVDNSLKYINKKNPKIELYVNTVNDGIELIIEDNGPGIPEDFRSKVFEIFQTLQSKKTGESNGVGLAIVNKIVRKNKGVISIFESKKLGGVKFYIKLNAEVLS